MKSILRLKWRGIRTMIVEGLTAMNRLLKPLRNSHIYYIFDETFLFSIIWSHLLFRIEMFNFLSKKWRLWFIRRSQFIPEHFRSGYQTYYRLWCVIAVHIFQYSVPFQQDCFTRPLDWEHLVRYLFPLTFHLFELYTEHNTSQVDVFTIWFSLLPKSNVCQENHL